MRILSTILACGFLVSCGNTGSESKQEKAAVTTLANLASPYLSCTARLQQPEPTFTPVRGSWKSWDDAQKAYAEQSGKEDTPCKFYQTHHVLFSELAPKYPKMKRTDLEYFVSQTIRELVEINRGLYRWKDGRPDLPVVAPPPPPPRAVTPLPQKKKSN